MLNFVYLIDPPTCATGFLDKATVEDISKDAQSVQRSGLGFQRIYPDIQFTCNGVITKWTIGALDLIFSDAPELQVWRLVGENYIKVSSSLFRPNETNHRNIHVLYPTPALEFQSGDIFGVHTPIDTISDLSVLFQRFNGPQSFELPRSIGSPAPTTIPALALRPNAENNYPLVTLEVSVSTSLSPDQTAMTNNPRITNTVLPQPSSPDTTIYLIIGAAGGGIIITILLVIVVLIIVCLCKSCQKNKKAGTFHDQHRPQNSLRDNPSYNTNRETMLDLYSSYHQYHASDNGTIRNNHTSSEIYETVDEIEDNTFNTDTNPSYVSIVPK